MRVLGSIRAEIFVSQFSWSSVRFAKVFSRFSSFGSFETGGPRCVSVTIASGGPGRSAVLSSVASLWKTTNSFGVFSKFLLSQYRFVRVPCTAFSSMSEPMTSLFWSMASIRIVPLPQKGS